MAPSPHSTRYYQVVFIWIKDGTKFARYLDLARPIVERYGGALERMLVPETIHGAGVTKPDIVNIVFYSDRDAFHRLGGDPEFQPLLAMRAEAIDMMSVEGIGSGGELRDGDLTARMYSVELAQFGSGGSASHAAYVSEAEPLMRRFGYHVERGLQPETSAGFPFTPDIVNVTYFDTADALARLDADPSHARVEGLYGAAVSRSVWAFGRVHPATIR
jgi:uncharacterized protein (DUF1330 family)